MCDSPLQKQPQATSTELASWTKLQPILEKYILKNNINGGLDKGLDTILTWFEIITKSNDRINTFRSMVGLSSEEERKIGASRLAFSTSSIADIVDREEFDKKRIINDEDSLFDYRNKRMKVSRLLCHEDMNGKDNKSDDENSEDYPIEDENSGPDSLESNSPNGEGEDYASDSESLQIDEAEQFQKMNGSRKHSTSSIDLSNIKLGSGQKGSSSGIGPSPKQLMIIREKMLEYVQKNPSPSRPSCIQVIQSPGSSVVWKNRRLDTPFKLKVDVKMASTLAGQQLTASQVVAIGVVTDHKGKLQIDSVENFTEAFNAQSMAVFQGLKMTKGTWGKEWNLTFIALARPTNNSYNNAIVISVSQPFSIVVKTRKNPQIRHNYGSAHAMHMQQANQNGNGNGMGGGNGNGMINSSASENSSSSPEASPTMPPRRGRLPSSAPLMSLQSRGGSFPFSRDTQHEIRFPQDDMASLLWAAEIKREQPIGSDSGSSSSTEPEIIGSPTSQQQREPKKYTSMSILSPPKQPTAVSTR